MARPLIFQFRPGKSPVDRWDVRGKTAGLFVFSLGVFALPWYALGFPALVLTAVWILARLSVRDAWKGLRGFLLFLLYVSLIPLVGAADPGGQALKAAENLIRFLLLILASHLMMVTTAPADIGEAFRFFLGPLGRRRAEKTALAASLALNTLPRILVRAGALRDAAVLRGARPRRHPFRLLRIWSLPLISRLMIESETLAWAIVLRGWGR